MSDTKTIYMFTDGACSGNPGPGGYGVVIIDGHNVTELHGKDTETTNNRMELQAVIDALCEAGTLLKSDRCVNVCINLDSSYVYNAITQCWVQQWAMNRWKNKAGATVKNSDLWKMFMVYSATDWYKNITFMKVRGHSNVAGNEAADKIAVAMRDMAVSDRIKSDPTYKPPKNYMRGRGYKQSYTYKQRKVMGTAK